MIRGFKKTNRLNILGFRRLILGWDCGVGERNVFPRVLQLRRVKIGLSADFGDLRRFAQIFSCKRHTLE